MSGDGARRGESDAPREVLEPARSLDAVTRRLVLFAAAYGVLGAGVLIVVGGVNDALVLTAGVAASIFVVRSLRAQVSQLDPRAPRAGGRAIFGAMGRYAALALFLLVLFEIGSDHALAAALGAASLPCALLVETLVQVLGARARTS